MLARVSSGSGGIAEYLTTGRKKGREFDRDLIDERITLDGNLEVMDAVIEGIETAQEGDAKYLHITLGFAEDFTTAEVPGAGEINLEKMKEVTAAYRAMLMTAYDPAEYAFYAEAHIPKVSHEINESTGEYEKRLPHVHIVIPMRNIDTDQYLNPLGFGKANLEYHDAIQEKVNADFGLRSPRDFRRAQVRTDSPLAKHNEKFKEMTPKQVRASMQAMVANGEVQSFDQLAKAARQFGEVKIRNGKDGDYINVKPSWADKGINFKDVTRQNFEVQAEALKTASTQSIDFEALVAHWQSRGAFEARYITSGNRKMYKALDEQGKAELLQRKQQETKDRLTPQPPEDPNERPDYDNIDPNQYDRTARSAAILQSGYTEATQRRTPKSLASLRDLSSLPMVQEQRDPAMLLQDHAPDRLEPSGYAYPKVRRSRGGDRGTDGKRRTAIRERALTVIESLEKKEASQDVSSDTIKRDTSPAIVLADAVKRYGIKLEDYAITSAKDGTPRIRHKDKHYNLGDFYTKHLGVPWDEARPILTKHYHMTLSNGLPAPDKGLWKSFNTWRARDEDNAKAEAEAIRAKLRKEIVRTRDRYKKVKLNSRGRKGVERQAMLAKGRAEHLIKIAEIKLREKEELDRIRRPSRNAQYRLFLTDLANKGNLQALDELRRMAPPETEATNKLSGAKSKTVLPLPSYKIDHHGKVTYFNEDVAMVTDSLRGVSVVDAQPNAYEIALKVAVARYGRDITLNGDALFMKGIVNAARKSGMDLLIRDANKPRESPMVIQSPRTKSMAR